MDGLQAIGFGAAAVLPGAMSSIGWRRALRLPASKDQTDRRAEVFAWSVPWFAVALLAWPTIKKAASSTASGTLEPVEVALIFTACVVVPFLAGFAPGLVVRKLKALSWLRAYGLLDAQITTPWQDAMLDGFGKTVLFTADEKDYQATATKTDITGEQVVISQIEIFDEETRDYVPLDPDLRAVWFPQAGRLAFYVAGDAD